MPLVRLEAVKDSHSDFYFVEIYSPADSQQPFVTTEPRYKSAAAAENDMIAIIASMINFPSSGSASADGSKADRRHRKPV